MVSPNNNETASNIILAVSNLSIKYSSKILAVNDCSFKVEKSEIIGIVGESGSGKSTLALSILNLLVKSAKITNGDIIFNNINLLSLEDYKLNNIRGNKIGYIFQNPMKSLHYALTIGYQLSEAFINHNKYYNKNIGLDILKKVGLPNALENYNSYPHQLSGGMQQRVMIAMSIINNPQLLIADEPTTSLDVTIQSQILELLVYLSKIMSMSIILITHNLGIVAQTCKKVLVMYKGEIVESGYVKDILKRPKHPYTIELLNSLPENNFGERINISNHILKTTKYSSLDNKCAYYNRCQIRMEICLKKPELIKYKDDHSVKCWINK